MSPPDYQYIDETGTIVPDTADILADVTAEYVGTFGDDLNPSLTTPQGVLIQSDALARAEVVENNAAVANQINPFIAGGIFLDAICAMTGLQPPSGTYSLVVAVEVGGQPSTLIPAGSQARVGTTGPIFETVTAVTLDAITGLATVDFQAIDKGEVPCAIGALDHPVTDVLGWETVDNPSAAILGEDEPSDATLRTLRANTLALQGISLVEAITSALNDTPGVRSISFRENIADTTQVIDGISMVAHSIWACVHGGLDADIAAAMLNSKSMGANWNGAVEVDVLEPASGQTYEVKFDRPDEVPVWTRVTIKAGTVTGDAQTQIRNAAMNYANGQLSGMDGLTVGTNFSPFEVGAGVVAELPGVFVVKVEVSDDGIAWQTTEYDIAIDELAVLTNSRISVLQV